jgi:hypothetical protein
MLEVSVTLEHGAEVMTRLQNLANAAKVFGDSRAEVGTPDPVGRYVVEGTRAHVIAPRDKKALFWEGARHPVREVHHPGTKANPFMQRALDKAAPEIDRIAADQLEVTASGGGGNYTQIMQTAGKALLKAVQDEAPVGPDTPTRKGGSLRQSLYLV